MYFMFRSVTTFMFRRVITFQYTVRERKALRRFVSTAEKVTGSSLPRFSTSTTAPVCSKPQALKTQHTCPMDCNDECAYLT